MAKIVDYFLSPVSPWTYLGGLRLERIAQQYGAEIHYKPADFGKIFAVSGGLPLPQRPKQRQIYRLMELERWREHLGIELNIHPKFFPTPSELAARTIVAARQQGADTGAVANAILRACWAEERNVGDRATLVAIGNERGLDGEALVSAAEGAKAGAEYEANTAEAIERQVFGAPTYIYKEKLYWGQDRLDFVERALAAG
ncbi:MAG: 2-hydroxychromene-2-carboxylate isomerase [Alphaproteobacteria bacterium]|nr:2-hydroxychromene-2-carboxylate isomerase [Alphaproteobacteria bacterium]